jgi:hypothetical protein
VDFTRWEEQAEKLERLVTAIRHRQSGGGKREAGTTVSLSFPVPTGALSPDSPLYIERDYDRRMRQLTVQGGNTIIIEGARQMGKSSLVARALAHARVQQCTVIDFDFQELDERDFRSLGPLLRRLADTICERLRLGITPVEIWKGPLGAKDKLTTFIQDAVLQGVRMPVVIVMDEVDRVFGRSYQDDFFALLRAWHNRRARDPLWKKLNLVLAYSTDPRQAIKDVGQSPFNVGSKMRLSDFTLEEVWELNRRYQSPLKRKDQIQSLMDIIGGHPYLAQQAFSALASQTQALPAILNIDNAGSRPFADHLEHYRGRLLARPELQRAMRQVLRFGNCPTLDGFLQLRALGLVTGNDHRATIPKCRLYAAYFQRVLL